MKNIIYLLPMGEQVVKYANRVVVSLLCLLVLSPYIMQVSAQQLSPDDQSTINYDTVWFNPKLAVIPGDDTPTGSIPNPASSCSPTGAATSITVDNAGAQKIAAASSAKVGYALYDSTGKALAEYTDTFENYGASITKSMILVAYLNQVGAGTLSAAATTDLTAMIEQSDNAAANKVFNLLNNPATQINDVAQKAGMGGYKYNTSDAVYTLGQSQITAQDFAKFFSIIDTLIPASQKAFALNLLSNITPDAGLLQAGLPGTVYSKEGWKDEPDTTNPFGNEGAPYVVNQAAQFMAGGTTYGVAVTVGGTTNEASGETIIKNVVSALIQVQTSTTTTGTPVTPGNGAPDGAAFPNLDPTAMANAINTWVAQQNPNSELKGLGATIVASAKNANINPFLIPTIAQVESALSDPTNYNVIHGSNSFGRSAAPGQPSFQGSRAWYWWSSVKASVDYTAPENNAAGSGGDQATFLRAEYGSQVDANNLLALIEKYAPVGDGNDPVAYTNNLQSWITQLVDLATGVTPPAGPTGPVGTPTAPACPGTTSCTAGAATATGPNSAILCEAEKYAGIYYASGGGHGSYAVFRQNCPENAIASAAASSKPDPGLQGPCATDCSGLVTVAVDAVYGQNFGWLVSNINGTMGAGDGTPASPDWQSIPWAEAQAGDIVTTHIPDGHVEIVDHIVGTTVYTFGSHQTGTQTGPTTSSESRWVDGAWRYVGPGAAK